MRRDSSPGLRTSSWQPGKRGSQRPRPSEVYWPARCGGFEKSGMTRAIISSEWTLRSTTTVALYLRRRSSAISSGVIHTPVRAAILGRRLLRAYVVPMVCQAPQNTPAPDRQFLPTGADSGMVAHLALRHASADHVGHGGGPP